MLKKIGFAALGLALLASPLVSSARTLPLSDDYGTGTTDTSVYCPQLSITLQKGARDAATGGQVSELQAFLTGYYDLDDGLVSGGFFGKLTQKYLIQFQSQQSLPAFGIAGSLTRAKIAQVCGGGAITPIPTPRAVPGISFEADKYTVQPGETTILRWKTQNATRCWMHSGAVSNLALEESIALSGTKQINPFVTYEVRIGCANEDGSGKDGPQATKSIVIQVAAPNSNSITVTAPNGGEQWEAGFLNTVTWTPYQYNPDINPAKDVTAYLERFLGEKENGEKVFETVGKVQESGKASIHWITGELNAATQGGVFAKPGQYYIRVVNNVTGAWDRSNAPFTLLPKPVDLKINGSDGPLTLQSGDNKVTVSWTSNGTTRCTLTPFFSGPGDMGNGLIENLPTSGSRDGYIRASSGGSVQIGCVRSDGRVMYDFVYLNVQPQSASLQIISSNGGEQIDPRKQMVIEYMPSGLKSVSVALYKNDQWKYWIVKDVVPEKANYAGLYSYAWTPSAALQELGNGDNAGAIFKIYITGQKADGTGYVDDKSDAPFSFKSESVSSSLSCTIAASPSAPVKGSPVTLTWTSQNARDAMIAIPVTGENILSPVNGSKVVTINTVGHADFNLHLADGNGATGLCSTSVEVAPAASMTFTINGSSERNVSVPKGTPATLVWDSTNNYACSLSADGGLSDGTTTKTSSSGIAQTPVYSYVGTSYSYTFACWPSASATAPAVKTITVNVTAGSVSESAKTANLANALTALESALKAMLAKLAQ